MDRTLNHKGQPVYTFHDWDDFIDYAENNHGYEAIHASADFSGSDSFGHALELAREGWPEGRDNVLRLNDSMQADIAPPAPTRRPALAVTGYAPDVPSAIMGLPEAMWQYEDAGERGRSAVLRLTINPGARAGVDAWAIENRGAAVLTLIDYLEARDVSCDLWLGSHAKSYGDTCTITAQIKRPGEVVEVDRLAFAAAHPSVLRRLIFGIRETDSKYQTVGASQNLPKSVHADGVHLPYMNDNTGWETPEKAMRTVLRYVLDQGRGKLSDEQLAAIKADWSHIL